MNGFLMDLDTAQEFFKRCIEREAMTQEERIKVMEEIIAEKKALRVGPATIKKLVKGKKVLHVKSTKSVKRGS